MTDNITRLDSRSKPREATCTHKVPGMAVHPPKRTSDLRLAYEELERAIAAVKTAQQAVLAALDGQGGAA